MYEPIGTIHTMVDEISNQLKKEQDDYIMECIHKIGFDVSKEELVKALNYDRQQYELGYSDRQGEIIEIIESFAKDWNNQSSKKIPYIAINELIEYIRQDGGRK